MSEILRARIESINVNPAGGVPKHQVQRTEIEVNGVRGDKQRNLKVHGGPQRAVSLYASERIAALQAEGHPISAGSTGENLTISGLDWERLEVGTRLRIGELVEIEITGYAAPCDNIAASFCDEQFVRISQKVHPGWSRLYAKVLSPGEVQIGDSVDLG